MTIYYMKAKVKGDEVFYKLDATTDIKLSLPVKVTSHAVEDGKNITDNQAPLNNTISLVGTISDAKSLGNKDNLSSEDFINGIFNLRDSQDTFTVYFSTKLAPWKECVFRSIEIVQDKKFNSVGTNSSSVDSYKVIMSIEQIRVRRSIKGSVIRASEIEDVTQVKEEASGINSQEDLLYQARSKKKVGTILRKEGFSTAGAAL